MSEPDVILYGEERCHKVRYYRDELRKRGIEPDFRDTAADPVAADELRALYGDDRLRFPLILLGDKKVRNPSQRELDKALARKGLYDPGVIHDEKSQRFIQYMEPADAFVSYHDDGQRLTLGHIEVPPAKRGSGLGARLAGVVFDQIIEQGRSAQITCPFMRKVAQSRPEWADYFMV